MEVRSNAGNNSSTIAFDLNDVSILVAKGAQRNLYIGFDELTSAGPILTKAQFSKLEPMLQRTKLLPYEEWKLSALRVDNCGKLLPQLPCVPQIRLVFQPLWTGNPEVNVGSLNDSFKEGNFGDSGIHLAFNVGQMATEMYQDFLNLKKINPGIKTEGMLGEHPILAAEKMNGPFSKELRRLILKYSLASTFDRIAIMGTDGQLWEFAATTEIRNGEFSQTPLPCQKPSDKTNVFEVKPDPLGVGAHLTTASAGCPDRDITALITGKVQSGDNVETQRALAIENPEATAFATTNCVSCHKTNRLFKDNDELRPSLSERTEHAFKEPKGVSNTKASDAGSMSGGSWELRAFGWGEEGSAPGISRFTLNDSMRIASELNELIRQGILK